MNYGKSFAEMVLDYDIRQERRDWVWRPFGGSWQRRISAPSPVSTCPPGTVENAVASRAADLFNAQVGDCMDAGIDLSVGDLEAFHFASVRTATLENERGML